MTEQEFLRQIEAIAKKKGTISKFEKNLIATAVYSVPLAKKLLEINTNERFNFYIGKDPIDINIIANDGSRYMYENPVSDVEKQLENFEKAYSLYGSLFIYGLGNGVLLKGILQNQTHKTIVVFEPEIEIIYIVFHLFDFSKELFSSRLVIASSELFTPTHYYAISQMKDVLNHARVYNLYINCSFYDAYHADMSKINENITSVFMRCLKEIGNDSTDALIGINHTTAHIPDMLESIPLKNIINQRTKKTKTAIIVSTGPSLNKQLELLKQIQNHATIISVDSSYPILKAHGIKPDYVTSIERVELTSEFFNSEPSEFDKDIIFLTATLTHPTTLNYLKGRNAAYILKPLSYEFGFEDNDFGYIASGQSAAHLSFDIAVALEHERIIFIGQDLAYGEDRSSHAKGHVLPGDYDKNQESKYTIAYGGEGMAETMEVWNHFREFFEHIIAIVQRKNQNLLIYNCTEGGARIAGTIEKPFKAVLEEVFDEIKPSMPLPTKLNEAQQKAKLKRYKKHIQKIMAFGKDLQDKCEKLFLELAKQVELAKELKEQGKDEQIDFGSLQKISAKLDKLKELFEDKLFKDTYYTITASFIRNQELELTAIKVRPSNTDEEKKEKLLEWVSVHGHWLFSIAGMISVMRENLEKSALWLK
ncbi:motility associated factor glycosyltransferase family protein [Campylobacter magnus]|uniref:motility associated factor glycosyltransferase family protein n=1 Tax=Campylobacter magnus TaxID=3026462 RepID=UPI0026DFAE28|nr:motility associated factor glycosyltransferase family protein [Campylobacter magnus]MDO2408438.1 motility associated factor glycosyltransferase family protein [Campylobacter magnus]